MLPPIKGLIENTLIDWEGKIASIIFLPGCNFRCPFCHAGPLVTAPNALETIPFSSFKEFLERQRGWIDGIVISGGEPTLHKSLPELCAAFREMNLGVKLDTNGSRPEVLSMLLERGLIDSVAMDMKAPLGEKYLTATGGKCDIEAVKESIALLIDSDIDYEFRMTVCPAFLDREDVIQAARDLRGAKRFVLQQFKPDFCLNESFRSIEPYPRVRLKEFAEEASKYVKMCFVRGEPTGEFTGAVEGTQV